jgi:sulfopyruvate decarboxylase alpha subunit
MQSWADEVHRELTKAGVRVVGYVPDAGHKRLIELCLADKAMRTVVLTTEEEGIGLAAGAWLGGARSALLMQSSGVGNIVNVLGILQTCRFPLTIVVTMRGEAGEFNSWQVPMGKGTQVSFETMGVSVKRANTAAEIAPLVAAAMKSDQAVAVLISQKVIGIKSFQDQTNQ